MITGAVLLWGTSNDPLYQLRSFIQCQLSQSVSVKLLTALTATSTSPTLMSKCWSTESAPLSAYTFVTDATALWHYRLGHAGSRVLLGFRKNKSIHLASDIIHNCVSCKLAKSKKFPFTNVEH